MKYKLLFILFAMTFIACKNDADWKPQEVVAHGKIKSLRHSAEVILEFDEGSGNLIDNVQVIVSTNADFSNAKTMGMKRQKGCWQLELAGLQDSATYYLRYMVNPKYMQFADSVSSFQAINPNHPIAKTLSAEEITYTTARLYGIATQGEDNYEITEKGFYYSLLQNGGEYERKKVVCNKGEGDFTAQIEYLRANADYYFWAYATNRNGEAFGDTLTFHTLNPYLSPTDLTE